MIEALYMIAYVLDLIWDNMKLIFQFIKNIEAAKGHIILSEHFDIKFPNPYLEKEVDKYTSSRGHTLGTKYLI